VLRLLAPLLVTRTHALIAIGPGLKEGVPVLFYAPNSLERRNGELLRISLPRNEVNIVSSACTRLLGVA